MSSRRIPGPNVDGNLTTTVAGSGAGDGQRLAADQHRVAEPAPGLLVVERAEREHDVGRRERRAVGEGDAGPQLEGVGQAVGRRRPRLGEPGLEFLGPAVDAHEPGLREVREEFEDRVAAGVPVEGPRLGADGRDQRLRGPAWRRPAAPLRGGTPRRPRAGRQHGGKNGNPGQVRASGSGQLLVLQANGLAGRKPSKPLQIPARSPRISRRFRARFVHRRHRPTGWPVGRAARAFGATAS